MLEGITRQYTQLWVYDVGIVANAASSASCRYNIAQIYVIFHIAAALGQSDCLELFLLAGVIDIIFVGNKQ